MVLLDTHAWLWSVDQADRHLGRRARQLLSRADLAHAICISPASVFEITTLCTSGRLTLGKPTEQWVRESLAHPGVRLAELTPSVAMDAGMIPRSALPDPLDRFLVATARQLGATLLTADARILDYGSRPGRVRVHDARA